MNPTAATSAADDVILVYPSNDASGAGARTPAADPSAGRSARGELNLPVELCDALHDAWQTQPIDRVRMVQALARCVHWLRARRVPPEQVLLTVKERLPVDQIPPQDRLGFVEERSVLLRLTLAAYFGDGAPPVGVAEPLDGGAAAAAALVRLWPEIERRAARPHPARGRTRTLRDAQGREWRVYERTDLRTAPTSATSLIFEREGCMRRRRAYPPDWAERSEAALTVLLEHP